MTLFEIVFSIPGLIAMSFVVPGAIALALDWIKFTIDTIRDSQEPLPERSLPKGQNIVELETMRTLSEIAKHPALRQHKI